MDDQILYEVSDRVAVITLNRPQVANAQTMGLLDDLDAAWTKAASDEEVGVIVLRGNGKHFSSGHDLKDRSYPTPEKITLDRIYNLEARKYLEYSLRWRNVPKPSIAAVQGKCIAGGLLLCWPCDLIVAADNAEFSDPVVFMGIGGVEYHGHTWELGPRKAKEILFTGRAVTAEEVLAGQQGVLTGLARKGGGEVGGVVAVHSTVHPDTCRRLAGQAAAAGTRLVDAPVSGGGSAAAEGRLLVMAGGDAETVEYCRPVFATYADPVVHLGPVGSGQLAKLLNNLLFTAHLGTAAGVLELGQGLGIDPGRLAGVICHGSGSSFALERITAAGGTLDRIAAHAGPLLAKDVRLVADVADAAGVPGGSVLAAADAALALMNQRR